MCFLQRSPWFPYSEWIRKGQEWKQQLGSQSLLERSRWEMMTDRGGDDNQWMDSRGILKVKMTDELEGVRYDGGRILLRILP